MQPIANRARTAFTRVPIGKAEQENKKQNTEKRTMFTCMKSKIGQAERTVEKGIIYAID